MEPATPDPAAGPRGEISSQSEYRQTHQTETIVPGCLRRVRLRCRCVWRQVRLGVAQKLFSQAEVPGPCGHEVTSPPQLVGPAFQLEGDRVMSDRSVFGVLMVFGLALGVSSSAWAGVSGTVFGQPGDGYIDLYIDLWPGGQLDPPSPRPPEDTGFPGSWLDNDGNVVNGFVIQSSACIFDGPEAPVLTGLFQSDTDCMISDGFMIPTLNQPRYLGDIFRTSILPAVVDPPNCWTVEQFLDDLTLTYRLEDQPGTFYGDIIVTEHAAEPCEPPVLGDLPLQLVDPGQLAEFLVTATDADTPPAELTFSLDPALSGLVNPWPDGMTIDAATGLLNWQVQGAPGELFDAGIVVTDSCPGGGLTDTGVLTFQIASEPGEVVPEPGTALVFVAAFAVVGVVSRRRRRGA